MTTGKIIVGVTVGVLLAMLVAYVAVQAVQPQDCGLQLLEEQNGDRAPSDVDEACR